MLAVANFSILYTNNISVHNKSILYFVENILITQHLGRLLFLKLPNPFLSCQVAFYINRSSNKRSLLNNRTINYFLSYKNQSALHRVADENRSRWLQLAPFV